MEYTYQHIPVSINGETHFFDYRYSETDRYGQACHISSKGKELVIDEDLDVLENNMPEEWIKPAIDKLLELLRTVKD